MIEDKIATNQHQQLPIQCLPLSSPLLEASLASQVSSRDGQEEGEDPQGHFFYQEPNVRRLRFKTKAHIEGGTIWLPLKFDGLLQKEEKIISKEMSLQKKVKRSFQQNLFSKTAPPSFSPTPAWSSLQGVTRTGCSSSECSCWLLKMHLCFKVLLPALHWTHFKQLWCCQALQAIVWNTDLSLTWRSQTGADDNSLEQDERWP